MMLIGKTANWLLRHSVQRCVKSRRLVCAHARNHASTPTSIIPTKFEVDMTIHCRVIAFLSADTSRDFVTLTFDLLTLNRCCAWRVTLPTVLPSLKTLRLSVLELWVITFAVDYLWKCVRCYCVRIFSNICTAHVQKQLFMNFRCKFWHRRSIRRPDFLLECKISAIWRRFPLNLAFYMLNVRHISTSGLFNLLT